MLSNIYYVIAVFSVTLLISFYVSTESEKILKNVVGKITISTGFSKVDVYSLQFSVITSSFLGALISGLSMQYIILTWWGLLLTYILISLVNLVIMKMSSKAIEQSYQYILDGKYVFSKDISKVRLFVNTKRKWLSKILYANSFIIGFVLIQSLNNNEYALVIGLFVFIFVLQIYSYSNYILLIRLMDIKLKKLTLSDGRKIIGYLITQDDMYFNLVVVNIKHDIRKRLDILKSNIYEIEDYI